MSSLSFLSDPHVFLVADASVLINLNATAEAQEIIAALPGTFVVTESAFAELADGARNGHDDARQLHELVEKRVSLGAEGNALYASLIAGTTLQTLDDGEAATIAYAHEVQGIALIDERKARRICTQSFPDLSIASTIELLLHERIAFSLGEQRQTDAIFKALSLARMRVLPEYENEVARLIGEARAAICTSLPRRSRAAT
jgi:predicted nucleic acid-binding protein